jgi:hypothetical protein
LDVYETPDSFFFFVFSSLHADVSKYFKKCENKATIHKMKNIDFIYLINLDKRPERLQHCLSQLRPYGIYPYRFSAVNGYAFKLEELNEMGIKLSKAMITKKKGIYYKLNNQIGSGSDTTEAWDLYEKPQINNLN